MTLSVIDHVTLGLSRLISQYKDQPRVEALLTSYLNRAQEIEQAIIDTYSNVLNLDDAVGDNLDIVGSILDLPRGGQPDYIYRRRLLAKTATIRSDGTVEDLIDIVRKFEGLYASDGVTPDDSEIYLVTSEAWDGTNETGEGKGTEISIFPVSTNEYTDPNPFDPKGMHDQLLNAKGGGEPIQSIYPIVNVTKSPINDSFRLVHSESGGFPRLSSAGFGSIYVTGSDGTSTFGGTLGHRRFGYSIFADPGTHFNVVAPVLALDASLAIGTSITITPGTWAGLPQEYRYTLLRSSSAGLSEISGYQLVDLADANAYTIDWADIGLSLVARETAIRSGVSQSADSNYLSCDIQLADSNLNRFYRFNEVNGEAEVISGKFAHVYNLISPTTHSLSQSFASNRPESLVTLGTSSYGQDAGAFAGPAATFLHYLQNLGAPEILSPYTVMVFAMPTGTLDPDANKYSIFGNFSHPLATYAGNIFVSQSKWYAQTEHPSGPSFSSYLSGGNATSEVASAIAYYDNSTVGSSSLWVDDFRTNSAINGTLSTGSWSNQIYVGWDGVSVANAFQGFVWEIAIRTGSLSETDRKLWASYYSNRYGVTVLKD